MLEFLSVLALVLIGIGLYSFFTADEVHFRITINNIDLVKYDKPKEDEHKGEK